MRAVTLTFDTVVTKFAGTVKPGQFKVAIVGTGLEALVDAGPVTFNVEPGDYVATVVRLDTAGAEIGAAVSAAFTVPEDFTMVAIPGAFTITVAESAAE